MFEKITKRLISKKWNKKKGTRLKRFQWWESPSLVSWVNETISGTPSPDIAAGGRFAVKNTYPGRTFEKAISVGGGVGGKEMGFVSEGIVKHFTIYELSKARIERGQKIAQQLGLEGQVEFILGNAFKASILPGSFDFVHWDNSLHHMFNTRKAVQWSHTILKPGGVFYMNDYIGPNRHQWTPIMLKSVNSFREALPDKYFLNPKDPQKPWTKQVQKRWRFKCYLDDPSEAADSENILPAVREYFPLARIIPLGGVMYHLALSNILHNIHEKNDADLLKKAWEQDRHLSSQGLNHYAFCLAEKPLHSP